MGDDSGSSKAPGDAAFPVAETIKEPASAIGPASPTGKPAGVSFTLNGAMATVDLGGQTCEAGAWLWDWNPANIHHVYFVNGSLRGGWVSTPENLRGADLHLDCASLDHVAIETGANLRLSCGEISGCALVAIRVDCDPQRGQTLVMRGGSIKADTVALATCNVKGGKDSGVRVEAGDIHLAGVRDDVGALEVEATRTIIGTSCRLRGSKLSLHGGHTGQGRLQSSILVNCVLDIEAGSWSETDVQHRYEPVNKADLRLRLDWLIKAYAPSLRAWRPQWAPRVHLELALTNVAFDGVEVDVETLAGRCKDLSTVDIQQADITSDWERLRDNYTGPMLLIHFLLLMVFVVPLSAKVLVLSGASYLAQGSGMEFATAPLWQVILFGIHGPSTPGGWFHAFLSGTLILYNILRLFITVMVNKLRAREEHLISEKFKRSRPHPSDYRVLAALHRRVMWIVFLLAVIAFFWRLLDTVRLDVPVGLK